MKTLFFLLAIVLAIPSRAQDLDYPGLVFVSSKTFTSTTQSWHWQQLPGVWKPFALVLPTENVATCDVPSGLTGCSHGSGTPYNRRWMLRSDLTEASVVRICGRFNGGGVCTSSYYLKSGEPVPPGGAIPDSGSQNGIPLTSLRFTNVTTSLLDGAIAPSRPFWAGAPDVNGDGCLDLFVGNHSDDLPSSMWLQNRALGNCAGTWVQVSNPAGARGFSQAAPVAPRITSRFMWGNWTNDPDNLPSFFGSDIDGGSGAWYRPNFDMGSMAPEFLPKGIGCHGSRMMCLPMDIDGDGLLEVATSSRISPHNSGHVRRLGSGRVLYPGVSGVFSELMAVFDVNNDGWPEIVQPGLLGYWVLAPSGLSWVANTFIGDVPSASGSGNHCAVLDYDSDGDSDLYCGIGTYAEDSNRFTPYLWRNDAGVFVNVTLEAGIVGLKNTVYWTTYANTVAGDLDNDGYPELVMFGEGFGHTSANDSIAILYNNGDSTFTVSHDNNFGLYTGIETISAKPWGNVADMDGDGRLDIIKTHGDSGPGYNGLGIFRNVTSDTGHWLAVDVESLTKEGLHARIEIRNPADDSIVSSGEIGAFSTGYQNLNPHFGVGSLTTVDVLVHMPNGGATHVFDQVAVDQKMMVDPAGVAHYRAANRALLP